MFQLLQNILLQRLLQRQQNYRFLYYCIAKNSSIAYVIPYELIDLWVLDSNRRVWVWSLPWRWHILSILLTVGRGISAETCGLDDVFLPDNLCSRPFIHLHSLYEFWHRTFIYIHKERRSILVRLHPITVYRAVFGGVRGPCVECQFLFSLVYQFCLALW